MAETEWISGPFEPDLVKTSVGKWRTNFCYRAICSAVYIQILTAFLTGAVFLFFTDLQGSERGDRDVAS